MSKKPEYEIKMSDDALRDLGKAPRNIFKNFIQTISPILRKNPYPTENGTTIKKLKGAHLYRYKVSDYRIIYTIERSKDEPSVTIRLLGNRKNVYERAKYDPEKEGFTLSGIIDDGLEQFKEEKLSSEEKGKVALELVNQEDHSPKTRSGSDNLLDDEIKSTLMEKIKLHGVPDEHHENFKKATTDGDLIAVISKLDRTLGDTLLNSIYPPDLSISSQGKIRTNLTTKNLENISDKINFDSFNLDLDPGQKRFVNRFKSTKNRPKGPYQIKGPPGSGKSTVALYAMSELLKAEKNPKVLFTSYTRSLVGIANHLFKSINPNIQVAFRTIDSICGTLARKYEGGIDREAKPAHDHIQKKLLVKAVDSFYETVYAGEDENKVKIPSKKYWESPNNDDLEFILKEIKDVILGRGIDKFDDYKETNRKGRAVGLTEIQRRQIWNIYLKFEELLASQKLILWEHLHLAASKASSPEYDYVFIDETQDLTPAAITTCIKQARDSRNVFISIDRNQSIYRSYFEWSVVKDNNNNPLNFTGKSTLLKQNHRTTKQIWQNALNILEDSALRWIHPSLDEVADNETLHQSNTPKRVGEEPTIAKIEPEDQSRFIEYWLIKGMVEECVTLSGCVILVPNRHIGIKLQNSLRSDFRAKYMDSGDLSQNISYSGLKITTYHAVKGWGFPLVIIAGIGGGVDTIGKIELSIHEGSLIGFPNSPYLARDPETSFKEATDKITPHEAECDEVLQELRMFFTISTRAGRRLLYLVDPDHPSLLYKLLEPGCILNDDDWYKELKPVPPELTEFVDEDEETPPF